MTRTALIAALALLCAAAGAGDWPQWRGPALNGSAEERRLPHAWSPTENTLWVAALPGPAAATPVVVGDRVFVSSTVRGSDDLLALCYRVRDGALLWERKASAADARPPSNTMAAPSPVADRRRVFFLYGTGDLAAFTADGKPLWTRRLGEAHGRLSQKFGYGSSPLLHGNRIYVQVLRCEDPPAWAGNGTRPIDSFLLALDAATGKDVWKRVRQTEAIQESQDAYTTPVLYRGRRGAQILVAGGDVVTAHDPATGAEAWRVAYNPRRRRDWRLVPSPVPGDGMVYAVAARTGSPLFAIPEGRAGAIPWNDLAWVFDRDTPDVCTPLLYRGRLYVLADERRAISCLDPRTGRRLWQGDLERRAIYRTSPTGADGKVYCISEAGDVTVLAAGDRFKVLSRFSMGERPVHASIAAAGGRLFVRTARSLHCIGFPRR
ncbi:MAG: PQQ-binding-like beta-propeller repeat protein [Armatimonadetes bacterium]|nr:PQQ-binding-like beta-propeller repeat protein [Armatimonadota bacterium]